MSRAPRRWTLDWPRPVGAWLWAGGLWAALWTGGAIPGATIRVAHADDWEVSRSEFDPRVVGALKAELRRRPEDAALLRRLVTLYRKYRSIDQLANELRETAGAAGGSGWDAFLVAAVERERGKLDEAARWLDTAQGRTRAGRPGPDGPKVSLALSELALKKAPPDLKGAATHIGTALADLKAGDPRRKTLLRRQYDLQSQVGDQQAAEQTLRTLLTLQSAGGDAMALRRELAETLARAGKSKEALAEWRQVADALAGDAGRRGEAELRIGELCETTGDDAGALSAYRAALARLPGSHPLRRELFEHLVALHRKRDDLPALIAQLEKDRPAASRSFSDWELLGRLYDERGDSHAALSAYRQALRRESHSIEIRRRLIAILERSGATSEVLREYEALIAQVPGDARPYLELAERLERAGQRQAALAWLRRAAARFGGDTSLHSALADLYQRWGEADLALAEAELLVRLEPKDESHIVTLGELYWARNKKDRADEIWRRLLNLFPSKATGQARLADVYAEHNLMNEALGLYEKAVRAEPSNLQLKRGLAQALERLNRPSDAVRQWEQIYFAASGPAERPLRLEARGRLAKLLRKETRLLPTLYSWQRRLARELGGVSLSSERMAPGELVALAVLVADVSLGLGQVGEAEAALSRLSKQLQPGPLLAEVLLSLVPIYQQQRKLDEAIAALKQAASMLPDRQRELAAQLAELSLQSYRDEDAVRYARQAIVDSEGELRLGEILERRDDVPAAMGAYRRAIELDSRLFRAHMALARLHMQRGELSDAATIYRDVVRRAPQEELVLEAGRRAVDVHEYLGTLGDLWRDLSPLVYAPVTSATVRTTYRKLLLVLYERYALPLVALSRAGDSGAQTELNRLGQGSVKPLTETLVDGDGREQRLAVTLLGAMLPKEAALSLLNLALAGEPERDARAGGRPVGGGGVAGGMATAGRSAGGAAARPMDIDLRVDALMIVARMAHELAAEPRVLPSLVRLAGSREKQLRVAALYALARAASKLPAGRPNDATVGTYSTAFDQAMGDAAAPAAVRAMGWLGWGELSAAGRAVSPRVRALWAALLERARTGLEPAEEPVLAAAVHAMGRVRDRSFVPQLTALLASGNDEGQRQAAWALGAMGDPRALAPLLQATFSRREPIRWTAAGALAHLTAASASAAGTAGGAPGALPAIWLDRVALGEQESASVQQSSFVERLLAASTTFAPSAGKAEPLWMSDAAPIVAALDEALLSHRDVAARTLRDLLNGAAADGSTGTAGATTGLFLGPLSGGHVDAARESGGAVVPVGAAVVLPSVLAVRVGQGILPTLRRLARAQVPQMAGAATPKLLDSGLDVTLREQALRVVARLLDLQDETLRRDAGAVLVAVAQGEGPDLALPALELLSAAHAAAASGQVGAGLPAAAELSTLLGDVMTRNLNSRERGVRVSTMTSALRIARVSPALIPAGVAQRAAGDADGYVRDMAARLQRR